MKTANEQASADFTRRHYYSLHRQVRLSNLGTAAMATRGRLYAWLFAEVFELRFPRLGDDRHALNGRNFDSLQGGFRLRRWLRLAVGRRAA